jgi:hypothetical protein
LISQFLANQLNSLQNNVNGNNNLNANGETNSQISFTSPTIMSSSDINNMQQIDANSSAGQNGNNENNSFLNIGSINYLPKI